MQITVNKHSKVTLQSPILISQYSASCLSAIEQTFIESFHTSLSPKPVCRPLRPKCISHPDKESSPVVYKEHLSFSEDTSSVQLQVTGDVIQLGAQSTSSLSARTLRVLLSDSARLTLALSLWGDCSSGAFC